jgi:hypothetical protein
MKLLAVPGDGLKAVAKAAELMVEVLGSKAAKEAMSHKRKTIKLGDVERAGGPVLCSKEPWVYSICIYPALQKRLSHWDNSKFIA